METDEDLVDEAPIYNWTDFEIKNELVDTLKSNGYDKPTEVQSHSLKYIKYFTDLIISARTGEGKTLCFLLPILNNLLSKYDKKLEDEGLTHESPEEELKPIQEECFRGAKALILSPTRELCIQIKEHCQKVIPEKYKKLITVCDLIGGMSLQKQERILSYRPTIIIATVGRVWELLDDNVNEFLSSSLPKIDVLVLDEADRMVELGHFKELNFILDFIYLKREEQVLLKEENIKNKDIKSSILQAMKNELDDESKFYLGKTIEKHGDDENLKNLIDNAEDLGDAFEDIDEDQLIIDDSEINKMEQKLAISHKKKKNKSNHNEMLCRKKKNKDSEFQSKFKGIQTIVCSATLILDSKGRIRASKKKKKNDRRENFDALEELCKKLKFKQKKPKVINLTEHLKLPSKLVETYQRCQNEEKDLYTFYFLQNHLHESTIIFVNSITCIKRLGSMLTILKVPHRILHSKMQQRARLKNFDRFRKDVENLTENPSNPGAVLVCTDVGARGLDIPNVQNIVHYQMPENAEVYLHRCGRTARIGKEGLSFSLFAPEDEKKFRLIYKILKGKSNLVNLHEDIKPMKVNVMELKRYEGFIRCAKDLEKAVFDKKKKSIRANWLLKMSESTGIELSDDLKKEIQGLEREENAINTNREIKEKDEKNRKKKREKKEDNKISLLKKDFHNMKQYKDLANVSSKSSFLNPTNVKYLNSVLFGGENMNSHELNKTILVDYMQADTDNKKKRKKSKVRMIKRRKRTKRRPLAKA